MRIALQLNDVPVSVDIAPDDLLLDVIRDAGLTGPKEGCSVGVCGACTVVIDGQPVSSCIYFAAMAEGRAVLTVEGVAARDPAVVDAFVAEEGMQCGICTPGQVVSAYALGQAGGQPSDEEIRAYMAGNLCRCTGYVSIIDAVKAYLAGR